jgi:hypothetical protein
MSKGQRRRLAALGITAALTGEEPGQQRSPRATNGALVTVV